MSAPISNYVTTEQKVRLVYNNYFDEPMSFPSEVIDAVIGFFEGKGFDTMASNSVAIVLLYQSRVSNINVFELVDTLRALDDVQLSAVVAQVLNMNRQATSVLGYKQDPIQSTYDLRNIRL